MTEASSVPLYCNPLLLEDDPSFLGSTPLAARFYFVKRGANQTWIWGGTTPLFMQAVASKIRYIGLSTSSPFSGNVAYQAPGQAGSVTFSGPSGFAWDAQFNRALWNATFKIWDDYTRRMGISPAYQQFVDMHREDSTATWMAILNDIKRCETEGRVNATAFGMACRLAASWFGLVDNLTTPITSPMPGTRMPAFGQTTPAARDPGELAYRPLIWPANGTIYDGQFPAFSGRPQMGVQCPDPQSYMYGTNGPAADPSMPSTPSVPASTSSAPRPNTSSSMTPRTTGGASSTTNALPADKISSQTAGAGPAALLLPLGYALGGAAVFVGGGVALITHFRRR